MALMTELVGRIFFSVLVLVNVMHGEGCIDTLGTLQGQEGRCQGWDQLPEGTLGPL